MAAALSLLAAGCGGDDGGSGSTGGTTAPNDKSSVETVIPSGSPPRSAALQLEQRHPNGSVVKVTRIDFAPTTTVVAIEALNGYPEKIRLANSGIQLRDDVGNRYNFLKPDQNANLELLPGATLKGTLTFLGVIDRKAESLRLLVNASDSDESVDLADESRTTTSPGFQFDFPISR